MTKTEIKERLEAVIKQQRAFYQDNENLKISDEKAEEKLKIITGAVMQCALFLLWSDSKEYHDLKVFAYGEDQSTIDELIGGLDE